jgi:peptide/nickel transport system substrate-binding protein
VRLVFDNIMSKADALKAVAAGDKKLDIVTQLTPADAKAFDGHGNAHIQTKDAKTVLAAVFNQTAADSPWKNIKVRQAMNMAVDRAALLKDAGGGYGVLMPAFIQKGRFGQDPSLKQYPYEPEKAKAELKTAGLEGKTITIGADDDYAPLVKQIGEELQKVGLTVKQVGAKDKSADMTLVWHFDWSPQYPVGVVYREFFGTGGAFLEGSDPTEFDKLAEKVLATDDLKQQDKAVQAIEAYEHEQANVLFLYSPATIFAVSNRTIFTPSDTFMFDGATIKLKTTKAEN